MPDRKKFDFDYGDSNRYTIKEVIGRGSYGVVCSAFDNKAKETVAIKCIADVFEHISDAVRILREIKLLRFLKHPDVVAIRDIVLPPSPKAFKDIYVVFELMETDLHQVIKANDDLTDEHFQYFLFQLLRGLQYVHSAKVFHRDIKPKNILANADCNVKICDFGLARPHFNDMPTTIFWTDYVATRWYRAPELCGSFFTRYSPAVDVWSVGCIFAELILGKPLFPGRNVVHQLELITNLLGTPPAASVEKIRNDKARRYLSQMKPKQPEDWRKVFPMASPGAIGIMKRLLAFDHDERVTAEEALRDPYFQGLFQPSTIVKAKPLSKLEFGFDLKQLSEGELRELMFREILEYHPDAKASYLESVGGKRMVYQFPSQVDKFKMQFKNMAATGPGAGVGGGAVPGGSPAAVGSMGAMGGGLRTAASLPDQGMSASFSMNRSDLGLGLGLEDVHGPPLSQSFTGAQLGGATDSLLKMSLDEVASEEEE